MSIHADRELAALPRFNIGIDMDDTLLRTDAAWKARYDARAARHGHRERYQAPPPSWEYPGELCEDCFSDCCYNPDILRATDLNNGAFFAVAGLKSRGHGLHLITHRSPHLLPAVRNALERNRVLDLFAGVHCDFTPKRDVCAANNIEIMVDDGPPHIQGLAGSGILTLIFSKPYNRHLDGYRAESWIDVVHFVDRAQRSLLAVANMDKQGAARG